MKLYYDTPSGHAHRARLFLSLIGQDVEIVTVDLTKGEHKTPEFLKLNSFGQLPVLEDDGLVIADSVAILVYLAKKFGRTDWRRCQGRGPGAALALGRLRRNRLWPLGRTPHHPVRCAARC